MKNILLIAISFACLIGCDMNLTININTPETNEDINAVEIFHEGEKLDCFAKGSRIYKCSKIWRLSELNEAEQNAMFL